MLSFSTVTSGEQVADAFKHDREELVSCLKELAAHFNGRSSMQDELYEALEQELSETELTEVAELGKLLSVLAEKAAAKD